MSVNNDDAGNGKRPRRTHLQMENELLEMQKLISTGYNDGEIMKQLGLTRRLYYYYKDKIYKASSALQARKSETMLAWEQQLLRERLTRLFRLLEVKAGDNQTRPVEAAACADIAQDIAINILRLENEGLRVKQGIRYIVHKAESQTKGIADNPGGGAELGGAADDDADQPIIDAESTTTIEEEQQQQPGTRPSDTTVF